MSELVSAQPDAFGPQLEPSSDASVSGNGDTGGVYTPSPTKRAITAASLVSVLATALSACGGGGGGGGTSASGGGFFGIGASSSSSSSTSSYDPGTPGSDAEAARFLLQAQFCVNDATIAAVRSQGYVAWLNAQYASAISQTGTAWLDSQGRNVPDANRNFTDPAFGDYMAWRMLMTGDDQLRKRCALALSELMVVSATPALKTYWPSYVIAGYWDMLNANVFGNFRTLLEEVTLNPAMGMYLNTRGSKKENPGTGREPDENYAREVMQLFTIGLVELNSDGTPKTDLFGNQTATYDQDDITNLARVFTGYDFDYSRTTQLQTTFQKTPFPTYEFTRDRMVLTASLHSTSAASFLGTTIPANTDGATALKTALDTLFNHANVGPFVGRQLIQRLVTSNPSKAYVQRVASAFADNGSGVRGDMKAVWTAILTDPEARGAGDTLFGKVREPMIRLAQWARTFNAGSTTGAWKITDLSLPAKALGQSPLRSPSVFNYFRPGYVPPQTAIADANDVAPEFQIHNETTTAGYINYMTTAIQKGVADVKPDYSGLMPLATDTAGLLTWLNLHLSANQVSSATLSAMQAALDTMAATSDADKQTRIYAAVLLMMACPEYLIQK